MTVLFVLSGYESATGQHSCCSRQTLVAVKLSLPLIHLFPLSISLSLSVREQLQHSVDSVVLVCFDQKCMGAWPLSVTSICSSSMSSNMRSNTLLYPVFILLSLHFVLPLYCIVVGGRRVQREECVGQMDMDRMIKRVHSSASTCEHL